MIGNGVIEGEMDRSGQREVPARHQEMARKRSRLKSVFRWRGKGQIGRDYVEIKMGSLQRLEE